MNNITQKLIILAAAMLVVLPTRAQEQPSDEKDVGEIPVQYALTPAGAVTYQVPMDIHPDLEEFQPRLSFSYNSLQPESAVGYGWNIGGLSGITHVAGTIHYDGKSSPLSLNEDKLMLDGVRLIKTGTDAWQTEQGFVKVKKQADGSLEARYPDGNTALFETSPQAPFSYVMTQCKNRKGRTVKYVYTQADNMPYIHKIMYNQVEGAYNDSVAFTYRNITDGITRYVDGKPFKYSRLLEKVESYYKGGLWRRYRLSYQNRGVNLPVQLDCETQSRKLPPLYFNYGNGRSLEYLSGNVSYLERYFHNSVQGSSGYSSLSLSRGKFSQTLKSDGLISYPILNREYNEDQHLLVYKDLSNYFTSPVIFTAGKGFMQLVAVDVDGKGLEVPVRVNYYKENKTDKLVASIYGGEIDPNRYLNYIYTEGSGYVHKRQVLFGDFNGDGKTEMLAISSCYDSSKKRYPSRALLADLHNRQTIYDGSCFDYAFYQADSRALQPDRLIPMDYNGDGKTDICLININGTYVYEFTRSGFKQLAYSNAINIMHFNFESSTIKDCELMVADMNGDGNMDIILGPRRIHCKEGFRHLGDGICRGACNFESNLRSTSASGYKHYVHSYSGQECLVDPSVTERDLILFDWNVENGKQWKFLISTGNSSYSDSNRGFKTHTEELFYCFHETVGDNFILVDVDSDGLPDLLRNVRGKIYLHLNENGKISPTYNTRSTLQMNNLSAQFAMANVAQSYYWSGGLICVDNEKLHVYDYTHNESEARMLHDLTDSYGVKSKHRYMDIMKVPQSRYVSTPDESLGYVNYLYTVMTPHLHVLSSLEKTKGNDQLSLEYYNYTNAVFHRTGLGFRGFRKITTEDVVNKRKMASIFDPELLSAEIKRETPTDTIVRKYVLDRAQNNTLLLKLQRETVTNVLSQTEAMTEYEYNDYGQPIRSEHLRGVNSMEISDVSYLNVDTDDTYLLGLQTSVSTEKRRSDSISTSQEALDYDPRYLPVHKKSSIDGNTVSEERFEYDAGQMLVKREQRPYEAEEWFAETYVYDKERRLIEETNAMAHSTGYNYDEATGLLQSTTDHKGRTTSYEYDTWGRLLTTRYPDGRTQQMSMAWSKEGEPGTYSVTAIETGKPVTRSYYDFLKREVRTSQIRFDGREMKTDKVYNTKTGLLAKESLPTKDSIPVHWNSYSYDKYNRLTSTRYASGKIDSCAYGVLTDTIVENDIRRIRKYDEAGMMTKATDAAGSINYYYRPDGQPVIVVAPGSVQTRFYYDKYGRRTAIKDPSAGIRRTSFDKLGNVCKETDADGREIMKEYDRYGRLTKQVTSDLTTVYSYDDTENLLLSAVSSNGSSMRNTYDEYGRLVTQREEAPDSKWLEKTYTYMVDGLPASVFYTSQDGYLATEQLTYRNGFLSEVRLADSTVVYRHDEENSQGQLTKLTAGGMQRNYAFNNWGAPIRRSITRPDGSILFDYSYRFNAKNNNLESRTDAIGSLTESFGYDALNRLTTSGDKVVEYDDCGNIRQKGDAGALAYTNPNRPYAVTGLTPIVENQINCDLDITYTAAERPSVIAHGTQKTVLTYNAIHERIRMQYSDNSQNLLARYYLGGNYELDVDSTGIHERLYLGGGYYDASAVLMKQDGATSICFVHRDYLGSIMQVADAQGNILEENDFDAWGCRRDPSTQKAYAHGAAPKLLLGRGYTGHEHLEMFGMINMNARLYDPVLGRFLSPDPYVQMLDFTQAFNRYSYALNNPFAYIDPSGEIAWFVPVIIGAVIGAYSGGVIANEGQYNPARWNYTSGKTWGFMLGGAVVGGVSGYASWGIAGSGIPMANTAAIAGSSLINSVGNWAYTGGQTPISISLGIASYDFTNGNFGYLGEKGNKWYENAGYGLGTLANASDILTGLQPKGIDLVTEHSDGVGHSAIVKEGTATGVSKKNDPNALISVGTDWDNSTTNSTWHWMKGKNSWDSYSRAGEPIWRQNLKVNMSTIEKYSNWLNTKAAAGKLVYSLEVSSCVTHTSAALNLSGIFNIGIHPYLLNAQMYLWSNGIRPWTFNQFLNR